jgi:hypothetical protein
MNLISCNECGVVLDKDKISFPFGFYKDDGEVDNDKAEWDSSERKFVAVIPCPVCKENVRENQ